MAKILQQLRELIEASEQSRYRIWKDTGIDQGQLSKLVHGKAGVSVEVLERLIEYLDLEVIIRPAKRKGK